MPNIGDDCGSGLALKADLSLAWGKLRKLRQRLSSFGVKLNSEAKMQQEVDEAHFLGPKNVYFNFKASQKIVGQWPYGNFMRTKGRSLSCIRKFSAYKT